MRNTRVGTRYAKALFDLALEQDILEKVKSDMELILQVVEQNKDFRLLLKSPIIKPEKKEKIIKELLSGKIQTLSLHFILLITRKRREAYIENITTEFIEQYKAFRHIITTHLETADEINAKIKNQIIDLLKKQTKGEIELIHEIKKELIGGFVLKYSDYQYDASIMKQIDRLKKDFEINLYQRKI